MRGDMVEGYRMEDGRMEDGEREEGLAGRRTGLSSSPVHTADPSSLRG